MSGPLHTILGIHERRRRSGSRGPTCRSSPQLKPLARIPYNSCTTACWQMDAGGALLSFAPVQPFITHADVTGAHHTMWLLTETLSQSSLHLAVENPRMPTPHKRIPRCDNIAATSSGTRLSPPHAYACVQGEYGTADPSRYMYHGRASCSLCDP